jgi:membrane protein required for colicin V production
MNSIDTLIVVVVLLFGVLGIYWGLIRQVLAITGLIAGVVVASRYGATVADALSSFIPSDTLAQALGFLIVLGAVSGTASLLATLLRRFVGLLFLGWLDHLIGGLLGVVQGLLACTVLLIVLATFPNALWATALGNSRFAPGLVRTFDVILRLLPEPFRFAARITFGAP